MFIKHSLNARCCAWSWEYKGEQKQILPFPFGSPRVGQSTTNLIIIKQVENVKKKGEGHSAVRKPIYQKNQFAENQFAKSQFSKSLNFLTDNSESQFAKSQFLENQFDEK